MLISNMAAKFVRADIHPVNLFLSFSIYLHLDEAKVIFFVQRTKPMSGKKQGEIICFDLAYAKFADKNDIPCLHFNLYDKMELAHGNQQSRFFECSEGD